MCVESGGREPFLTVSSSTVAAAIHTPKHAWRHIASRREVCVLLMATVDDVDLGRAVLIRCGEVVRLSVQAGDSCPGICLAVLKMVYVLIDNVCSWKDIESAMTYFLSPRWRMFCGPPGAWYGTFRWFPDAQERWMVCTQRSLYERSVD